MASLNSQMSTDEGLRGRPMTRLATRSGLRGIESRLRLILSSFPITVSLVGINVTVFLILPVVFRSRYPYRLESLGALWGPLVFSGEWWRVLSCSFVHFELSHLIPNMIGLWILGTHIERELGKWTFLFSYLVCGVVV